MFTVAINENKVVRCTTHNDARNWANRLYEAYADIVLNGSTDDSFAEEEIHKYDIDGEVKITINYRNYEEYLTEEDLIRNRIN